MNYTVQYNVIDNICCELSSLLESYAVFTILIQLKLVR